MKTPAYLVRIWAERTKGLFDATEEATVLRWLSENWKRHRVVIVGSGFTKNAVRAKGVEVPLWADLSRKLASDLGVPDGAFDALQLPDMHAVHFGSRKRLRSLMAKSLNDRALGPGRAHDALWASNPAGIITTNFLDTVLEKSRPRRGQVVVADGDLGVPLAEGHRHLVYFHGHRRHRTTWVAGRQEYEGLPSKRPLVHAKVRQLLAEYPALIVGYSLTDPDFHLIYGETWRAMGNARPKGLALLPPTRPPTNAAEKKSQQVTRAYWETLGLSFVTFGKAIAYQQLDDAYARFFKLTEHVTTFSQLLVALERAPDAAAVPRTWEYNTAAGASAFDDEALGDVFRVAENRARWWRDVIAYSLDETGRKHAQDGVRRTNGHEHARRVQEGERKRTPKSVRDNEPVPLRVDVWIAGPNKWRDSLTAAKLLTLLSGGNETTRQIEGLLASRVERASIRVWLGRALNDSEFSPRAIERSYVAAFALLTDGDREQLRSAYHIAARHGEDEVADTVRGFLGRRPATPKARKSRQGSASSALNKAFLAYVRGNRPAASRLYATQYDHLLVSEPPGSEAASSLLAYFAAQGVLDCTTWETDIATIEDLQRKRDALALVPEVRRWRDRVRALATDVTKKKSDSRRGDGYEDRSGGWSASPGELWHQYERAKGLGAPLSIRRELLVPLLGTLPSAEHELQERLSNCVKDTGEWLASAFESGAFSTNRNAFFKQSPHLTIEDRIRASEATSRQMFSSSRFSMMDREARLEILGDFPDAVLADDLGRVAALIADSLAEPNQLSAALKALANVSHICPWSHLSRIFAKVGDNAASARELAWTQRNLPWEHWTECDNFWERGGIDLLRSLTRDAHPMLRAHTGERLWSLLDLGPKTALQRLARSWISTASETLSDAAVVRVAVGLITSFPALNSSPAARKILREARRDPDVHLLGIIARAATNNGTATPAWALAAITKWATHEGWRNSKKHKTIGPGRDIAEARCLVSLIKHTPQARRKSLQRLLQLAESTWSVLPELAPILQPAVWQDEWASLVRVLRVGGHSRLPKSWLLQRIRLASEVLNGDEPVRTHFMHSSELGFLRSAIVDGLAHGDSILANQAVYLLPLLCRHSTDHAEVAAIASAMFAAANDVRISVAHGAAFAAAYICETSRREQVSDDVLTVAQSTNAKLKLDPLAVVRRQSSFGRAKAIRHRRKA